jgi:hypothetical protein
MLNKKGKDIVCVGTYFDNGKKLGITEDLLIFLNKHKEKLNFDILLVSRSYVPERLQKHIDFLIFDKSNDILIHEGNSSANTVYDTRDGFVVYTSFENVKNTIIPAIYNFIHGLNYSKYMGYDNIHFMEYDMNPCDEILTEIKDNSEILKNREVDYVLYTNEIDSMVGGFFSTSLKDNKVKLFGEYNPDKFIEITNERINKDYISATCEKITLGEILKSKCNVLYKDYINIKSFHNIISHKTKIIVSFYFDEINKTYGCFVANISDEDLFDLSLELVYKNEKILTLNNFDLKVGWWIDRPNLIKKIEISDESSVICNVNEKLFANYTFDSYEKFEHFFKKNKKILK